LNITQHFLWNKITSKDIRTVCTSNHYCVLIS
jgi:hypothetical protein